MVIDEVARVLADMEQTESADLIIFTPTGSRPRDLPAELRMME